MADFKRGIERTDEGEVKGFSVPDAHTLFVSCRQASNPDVVIFQDMTMLWSLDELANLYNLTDPKDEPIVDPVTKQKRRITLGEKWCVTPEVIKSLQSKGEASCLNRPFVYTYFLRKTKNADNLKHRG